MTMCDCMKKLNNKNGSLELIYYYYYINFFSLKYIFSFRRAN
jgi:hypothetical protein